MKGKCVLCRKSSPSAHQYTLISPFDLKLDQILIQILVFEAIQKCSEIAMCNKVIFRSSELQMKSIAYSVVNLQQNAWEVKMKTGYCTLSYLVPGACHAKNPIQAVRS